jgi:hypothetical protein
MSNTTLREEFLRALKTHVKDVNQYCLHSLRSGGATVVPNKRVKTGYLNGMVAGLATLLSSHRHVYVVMKTQGIGKRFEDLG